MPRADRDPDEPRTLTHARLRAAQGDLAAARRILLAILDWEPRNPEAATLFAVLSGTGEPKLPRTAPGDDGKARLERWLRTIRHRRGGRRDAR